ncbi:MAG: transposase [Burkholderiales bacterium]|nr:transposase [Burkholderiales bacterium]
MDTKMDKRSVVVSGEPVRVTCNGRRYFSWAHKDAIVAKCLAPGASLAAVALANGFNANLVRRWVVQSQARQAGYKSSAKLLPVTIEPEPPQKAAADGVIRLGRASEPGSMEIRIGSVELVVHGAVESGPLSIVLETLLRSR